MKQLLAFPLVFAVVLLLAGMVLRSPSVGAEPFAPGQILNEQQVAAVTAAALAFITPYALDAVKPPDLALWGLRGLTTLDPRLTPDIRSDEPGKPVLRLIGPSRVLLARPAPAEGDYAGWGEAVAQTVRAGWDASDPVRRAGTGGVIRTFFDELFNHLDPYSRYAPPEEARGERLRRAGRASLGIDPGIARGAIVVRMLEAGGAAAQAGVKPGERILSVDGQPLPGNDLQLARTLLSGPDGSEAELSLRGHDGKVRNMTLTRALLPPETVTATTQGDTLVISMTSFARNTAARLAQELIRGVAATPPPRGVVIDLRGNRGGVLQQAVAAAAMLQKDGLVASTAGRNQAAAHDFVADGRDLSAGLPVVVLVDGRTASAAEIMAASLADQRRAVVIGSATLGKGLVQTITSLPDGGELFVSWSRVLAPRGWPIQGLGVLPQLCTSAGQDAAQQQFEELRHGEQRMATALARHRAARPPLSAQAALDLRNACPAAEGREEDMSMARRLIGAPTAYAAALLPPPPVASVLGTAGRSTPGLTPTGMVRN